MCTYYCPQCQTPEACQTFCLIEHMQAQIDLEGELNNNIEGQFTGKKLPAATRVTKAAMRELITEVIHS